MRSPVIVRHRALVRPPSRRPAWVRACLWLMLALLPLRGFASAEMSVAMAWPQAMTEPAAAAQPACHGAEHAAHPPASLALVAEGAPALATDPAGETAAGTAAVGEHGHGGTSACACFAFCAPALPGTVAVTPVAPPLGGALGVVESKAAPEGVPEALFRPPRG